MEEEGEQGGKVLRPALSVKDESSGQEEVRKRTKKKKKGKRVTMEASFFLLLQVSREKMIRGELWEQTLLNTKTGHTHHTLI